MDIILKTCGLSFFKSGRRIIEGVSFDVRRGECAAVVGPNGSGKTTLLRCLCRLIDGFDGDVLLKGACARDLSRRDIARCIGYVPQVLPPVVPMRALDFVLQGRYARKSRFSGLDDKDLAFVSDICGFLGVGALMEKDISFLSGGEMQLVMLASALAQEPDLLLLDEPAAFLDFSREQALYGALKKICGRATAVVFVTHSLNYALSSSSKIIGLKEGRMVCCASSQEALCPGIFEEIFDRSFTRLRNEETGDIVVV